MFKRIVLVILIIMTASQIAIAKKGKAGWLIFRKARSAKFKPITVTPVMAVRGDLAGLFYNPAVLSLNQYKEVFLLSELGLTNDVFGGAVYGHPMGKGCVAGGLIYYNAGRMELNWIEGGELKTQEVTAQKDLLGIISYGRRFRENISLGLTLKIATSRLFEKASATAFAGDIGVLYFPPWEKLTVSAAVQNLGTSSRFVDKANPLPFSGFVGAGYLIEKKGYYLAPGFDLTYLFDEQRIIPEIGFELGRDALSMNFGYRLNVEEASWHFGLTFLRPRYDIAYAFLPGIHLNSTHRISVGYRFGR